MQASTRSGLMLALSGICLMGSWSSRAADPGQAAIASAPGETLILPAMKAGGWSGGHATLISGRGAETVSDRNVPRQSAPLAARPAIEICRDPWDGIDRRGSLP